MRHESARGSHARQSSRYRGPRSPIRQRRERGTEHHAPTLMVIRPVIATSRGQSLSELMPRIVRQTFHGKSNKGVRPVHEYALVEAHEADPDNIHGLDKLGAHKRGKLMVRMAKLLVDRLGDPSDIDDRVRVGLGSVGTERVPGASTQSGGHNFLGVYPTDLSEALLNEQILAQRTMEEVMHGRGLHGTSEHTPTESSFLPLVVVGEEANRHGIHRLEKALSSIGLSEVVLGPPEVALSIGGLATSINRLPITA
ncbi:MAG TPA: hypothetical protein VL989_00980 [Candidatus Sulfotelmatobacter sp.]|nr:hypothetical protein [Candidatus Sulfotelmatobacter sp.]